MTKFDRRDDHGPGKGPGSPIPLTPSLDPPRPRGGGLSKLEEAAAFLKSFPDCTFLLWGEDRGFEVIECSSDLDGCVRILELASVGNEEVTGGRLHLRCLQPDPEAIRAAVGQVAAYLSQLRSRKFFRYAVWFHFPMLKKLQRVASSIKAEEKGLVALGEHLGDLVCDIPITKGNCQRLAWDFEKEEDSP